jgi:sRNA-binding carbon storage regulator CsrA
MMLGLQRHVGEAFLIRTPDGTVRVDVVEFDTDAKATTFVVSFPESPRPPLPPATLSLNEHHRVDIQHGHISFHVFEFRGRAEHLGAVRIGIHAPSEWAIERPDMIKGHASRA